MLEREALVLGRAWDFAAIIKALDSENIRTPSGRHIYFVLQGEKYEIEELGEESLPSYKAKESDNPIFCFIHATDVLASGRITALGLPSNKTKLTFQPAGIDELDNIWGDILFRLGELSLLASSADQNLLPPEPTSQDITEWFNYYHLVKPKIRIQLGYIARKTGYAIGTIYKEHSLYMAEQGIESKKVKKSKKK